MPIKSLPARQCAQVAIADFIFSDLVSGAYAPAIDLPLGAILTKGELYITTLFDSATTDTFSIGDKVGSAAANNTRYSATSADITAVGRAVVAVPTGIKTADQTSVGIVWTGAGAAPTSGVGKLVVEYLIDGKAESTFDN